MGYAGDMANCYVCGRPIPKDHPHLRRKVKTGEWARRRYPKRTVSSVNIHYGIRIVCPDCARRIDRERTWQDWVQLAELALALIVLFAILVFHFL
jgi:predicted nucleic acid-binding Zn ribbon protein